jgi:hypothetical protein
MITKQFCSYLAEHNGAEPSQIVSVECCLPVDPTVSSSRPTMVYVAMNINSWTSTVKAEYISLGTF